jgi:hypothetical protein
LYGYKIEEQDWKLYKVNRFIDKHKIMVLPNWLKQKEHYL